MSSSSSMAQPMTNQHELPSIQGTGRLEQEPKFRMADHSVQTREIAKVNEFLALTRQRLLDRLQQLQLENSDQNLLIQNAIRILHSVESVNAFRQKWNSPALFRKKGADWLIAYEWKHRYEIHLLGALKSLLEIREDFLAADAEDNLDYQCVEQLSPTGTWIACWVLVRGCVDKERRTGMGQGFNVNTTMCVLEAKIGRIIRSKGVIERERKEQQESGHPVQTLPMREETSHRCHQVLCCNPDHLVEEFQNANYQRMYCQALDTCAHGPHHCLLPHRNTRKRQYTFLENMIRTRRGLTDDQPTPRTVHRRRQPGRKPGRPRKHARNEETVEQDENVDCSNKRKKVVIEVSDDEEL